MDTNGGVPTCCVMVHDGGGGNGSFPYINGQHLEPYASIPYGYSTISDAGCEAIACYNTLVDLGMPESFSKVMVYFAECFYLFPSSGWGMGGRFGASPDDIAVFLDLKGIEYKKMSVLDNIAAPLELRDFISSGPAPGVFIVSYWNEEPLKYGYHTIAIKYNGCQFTAYNWNTNTNQAYTRGSIYDFTTINTFGYYSVLSAFYIPYAQN